uniref:Methyltransferase domain-containing protein n=1 Tax=Leersia perrieri TaxID=77586 RepID=A0A0D9XXR0_9ORYZ
MATGLAAGGRRLLLPLHLRAAHLLPPQSHLSSSASAAEGMDGGDRGGGRVKIFDRELKRRQRDRAAWAMGKTDALADAVADNLLDRLEDCRKAFPSALCLGGSAGAIRRLLRGRGGIEKLIMMDMSADMVRKWQEMENATDDSLETHFVVGDEEYLPIKERELRIACTIAQMEREGGISPRMSPLAQILKKDTALATAAIYQSMFGLEDGTIPATFQVIYMTGWKEHPSQQKAKRRGSATVSFSDLQKQFGSNQS